MLEMRMLRWIDLPCFLKILIKFNFLSKSLALTTFANRFAENARLRVIFSVNIMMIYHFTILAGITTVIELYVIPRSRSQFGVHISIQGHFLVIFRYNMFSWGPRLFDFIVTFELLILRHIWKVFCAKLIYNMFWSNFKLIWIFKLDYNSCFRK